MFSSIFDVFVFVNFFFTSHASVSVCCRIRTDKQTNHMHQAVKIIYQNVMCPNYAINYSNVFQNDRLSHLHAMVIDSVVSAVFFLRLVISFIFIIIMFIMSIL